MEKIETKFICLSEPAFFELIDIVYDRFVDKAKGDKWIDGTEAKRRLNLSSPTSLQHLRDIGAIRFAQPSKKIILYDSDSINEYLEKHANRK